MRAMLTTDQAALAGRLHDAVADPEFSGVVHVAVGDEVIFACGYGLADRDKGIANTVDTRFGTASATKLFTALGVGALVDDGAISLSTRLVDAVSAPLPGMDVEVTIDQLLGHTSGVFDYYDEELIDDFDNFELPIPPAELLRPSDYLPMLTGPQKFPPGSRFAYSNGGYVLLGLMIEELAGSYHDHLERRVLRPAGMDRSGFFRFDQLPPDTAIGYRDDGRTNADALPIIGGPDGGMFTTAGDLRRLWQGLLAGEIVSRELVDTFLTKTSSCGDGLHYGRGVWIRDWVRDQGDSSPVPYVEGCDAGVSIRSCLYPPDTVVTVVSNTTDGAWPVVRAVDEVVRSDLAASPM